MTGPEFTLRYADHADGVIDLWRPSNGDEPRCTVFLVHGGFWKQEWDRSHTAPMAQALTKLGAVVAVVEYRRVALDSSGGDGWPLCGYDVESAARQLVELAAAVDVRLPTPFVVIGHSAGGQLALWLATRDLPEPWDSARTLGLAPVTGLGDASHLGGDAVKRFLGGVDPDTADPAALFHVRPTGPVSVLHPHADEHVPVELSRALAQRHSWIDFTEVAGDHGDLITPGSVSWPEVVRRLPPP